MIFTITPLTNWGPIVFALAGGAEPKPVAGQFKNQGEKERKKKTFISLTN